MAFVSGPCPFITGKQTSHPKSWTQWLRTSSEAKTYYQHGRDMLLPSAEFAYRSCHLESKGRTTLEPVFKLAPESLQDLLHCLSCSDVENIKQFQAKLAASFNDAIFAHVLAQALQSTYKFWRCTAPPKIVGGSAWLDREYFSDWYSPVQPLQKLGAQRFDPVWVLELID